MNREALRVRVKEFLMVPLKLFASLFEQATIQGSRSTVLRPLGWVTSVCGACLLGAVYEKAPAWVVVLFGAAEAGAVLLYFGAYIFCLVEDRDALRSETYSIQKLAIQRGFIGDNAAGVFKIEEQPPGNLLISGIARAIEAEENRP
jgi:hypothetical protein